MSPTAWRGVAALILATGLAGALIILAIETVLSAGKISTEEASLLSTVLGATVGAVAVYLGQSPSGQSPGGPPGEEEPDIASPGPVPPPLSAPPTYPGDANPPAGPDI